jgi:hypothetical protein
MDVWEIGWENVDCTRLGDSCKKKKKNGNENSVPIKGKELHDWLCDSFSNMTVLHGSSLVG